jgi:tetratricopeptide (TPR) repeat protein
MSPLADFFLLSKDQILQKAEKLRSEGKHSKAAELLTSGLKNNAEDYELLLTLASAHLADRKGRDAVLALKNAVTLVPSRSSEIMEISERFFYNDGQLPEMGDLAFEMNLAKRNFDSAVKLSKTLGNRDIDIMYSRYHKLKESLDHYQGPAKPAGTLAREMTTYYGAALLAERKGQLAEAMDILQNVQSKSPDEEKNVLEAAAKLASYHPGDTDVLIQHGDILMASNKKDRALELYIEAAKSGATDRVINKLETVLGNDPDNIEILSLMARLYLQKQDAEGTFVKVARLMSLDKQNRDNWINTLREVVKINPGMTEAHMLLGDAALDSEKLDLAMTAYSQVAELEPQRLEEVLGRYRRIISKSPGNFEAATKIIDAYVSAKQTDKAIAAIHEIVDKDVSLVDLALDKLDAILKADLAQPEALAYLAECYLIKQEKPKAVSVYRYLSSLGKEQEEKALAGLQKLVAQDPSDMNPMIGLLEVLIRGKRLKESALFGAELARQHPASWSEYLPLLERASYQDGMDFNTALVDICTVLEKFGQTHPAIDFVKAVALVEAGQHQSAAEALLKLAEDEKTSGPAHKALEEATQKYPQAGHLQLALAESLQQKGDLGNMASALLTAIRYDKGMVPQVTEKLNLLLDKSPDNAELQMLHLELLFQEKLLDKAYQKAEQIISKWPDKKGARAHLRLGQISLERGELTKAAGSLMKASELDNGLSAESTESLKRLLDIDVTSLPGHYALARVLMHQRAYDQAIDELLLVGEKDPRLAENIAGDLKTILQTEPANIKALMAEAQIGIIQKKPEVSITALNQVLDIAPENLVGIKELYQKLLSTNPDNFRIKLALAKAHIAGGDIDQAGQLIESVVNADPGLYEQAISLLRLSQEKDRENVSSRILLARIYRLRGSFEQSIEILKGTLEGDIALYETIAQELQSIISLKPELLDARYLLAELYRRQGQPELEVREYQAIYKADSQQQGRILSKLEEIVNDKPELVLAVILSSRILADQGRVAEAMAGYMKACELDNAFRPSAVAEIEKLQLANPNVPEIFEALGTIYFELGKFTQARDMLTQASGMIADSERKMRVLFFLAEAHLALRDEAKADQAMNQVKEMMSDANEVYKALRRFASRRLQVEIDKAYQALQEAPDDQFKKLDLANKLIVIQKFDAAINLLGFKPIDEEVTNRRILTMAKAFWGRKEAMTAMELLRQVPLESHPFSRYQMEICYLLGQCYESLGNYNGAVAAYRNIYMDQTDYRDVRNRMEWCAQAAVMKELEHRGTVLEAGV